MGHKKHHRKIALIAIFGGFIGLILLFFSISCSALLYFDRLYKNRIFPNVTVDKVHFGGKTPSEVETYFRNRNIPLSSALFTLTFEDQAATISGIDLGLGYDEKLLSTQAYLIGRSPNLLSNINDKFFRPSVDLPATVRWNEDILDNAIHSLSERIDIAPTDALFQFRDGKVTEFKQSAPGRKADTVAVKREFGNAIAKVLAGESSITIPIPVAPVEPAITTDKANEFGIKDLLGTGYSEFGGSIPGRIHNVILAASKFHGVLIPPDTVFSFNDIVGDISAATGYQSAYIIKDGRTVLGDGGGVCQVSTTLFRAAMSAGLPVVERHEHSYRVHYYEEDGSKPGLDATVFTPTDDLKFKNTTPGYILIQMSNDLSVPSLTFQLYGTSDGRKGEILNTKLWDVTPPPPDLYQDDPTLPKDTVKQVDWSAWGAKASFDYLVTRNGEVINKQTFTSNYRPWQAVFLKGTKE